MTQKNIDIMDLIVDKMLGGKTISEALKDVYYNRKVSIPFEDEWLNISVDKLGMSKRTTYALMRGGMLTLSEVVQYCQKQKITNVKLLGISSGTETLETILNYLWDKMDNQKRVDFLIDTIEKNEVNLRKELM